MATKTKSQKNSGSKSNAKAPNGGRNNGVSANGRPAKAPAVRVNEYGIPDWRLEQPEFEVREITDGPEIHYEIKGKLNTPVPPIRESKYLTKEQHLELYRWMVMNRRMEVALENLYKQSKVVGGVYFGLGQEACSRASGSRPRAAWVSRPAHERGSTSADSHPTAYEPAPSRRCLECRNHE